VTIIDDPIPIASALLGRRAEIELLLAYGEEARCRLAIRGSARAHGAATLAAEFLDLPTGHSAQATGARSDSPGYFVTSTPSTV